MTARIDSHQHFWRISRGDYGWLTPELATLYRDFTPADLLPLLQQAGIDATVLVQAAPTVAETDYLLGLATRHDFIRGVVGWIDMAAPEAVPTLERLARHPAFRPALDHWKVLLRASQNEGGRVAQSVEE